MGGLDEVIRWLHISDLHFEAGGDPFAQNVAARALIDDAVARVQVGPPPSFVVVTGDLAYSGRPEQYDAAEEFLVRLAESIGVAQDRFLLVPGNHDVDRTKQRFAFDGVKGNLVSQADVDEFLGLSEYTGQILERQRAFWALADRFCGVAGREFTANRLAYVTGIEVGPWKLGFLGINSAWLCGENAEHGQLLVGERQIIEAIELLAPIKPLIVLGALHHPLDWLTEWDVVGCETRLLPIVDILHRGHLHAAQVAMSAAPESPCLVVAAGSGHATRHYMNSYNVIDLDLGEATCTVQSLVFLPQRGAFVVGPVHTSPIAVRSALPWRLDEVLVAVGSGVPGVDDCASYIGAFLFGVLDDLPICVDGTVGFVSRSVVDEFGKPDDRNHADLLRRARNLVRLFPEGTSLGDRIEAVHESLSAVADWLRELRGVDANFDLEFRNRGSVTAALCAPADDGARPRAVELLLELRRSGEGSELIAQARRYLQDDDLVLSRTAAESFLEAAMGSDDPELLSECRVVAVSLSQRPDCRPADYCLASASCETLGDDEEAVWWIVTALERFGPSPELLTFGRALALRTGSAELRQAITTKAQHGGVEAT